MKKILFLLTTLIGCLSAEAQKLTVSEVFKQMPDTLLPYLSANNRLDMIDFMEAKMKAEITNLLEGSSVMTLLTADSLSIMMNERLRVDIQLVQRDSLVVEMVKTYSLQEQQEEKVVQYFSTTWRPLSDYIVSSSTLLSRDEKLRLVP